MVVTVIPLSLSEVLTTFKRQESKAGSARVKVGIQCRRIMSKFMPVLVFRPAELGQPKNQLDSLKGEVRVGQV
jgi:hypothetical protein